MQEEFDMIKYEGTPIWESEDTKAVFKDVLEATKCHFKDEVNKLIRTCISCSVRRECYKPVGYTGDYDSQYMIVGRNPGKEEDRNQIPFFPLAPGGSMLESWFHILGIMRQQAYITNVLHCHTKNDRPPSSIELFSCSFWKLIELKSLPNIRYIFLLGNDAIRGFFGIGFPSVVRVFGNVYQTTLNKKPVLVFPVYHPGYVLRQPSLRDDCLNFIRFSRQIILLDKEGKLDWRI